MNVIKKSLLRILPAPFVQFVHEAKCRLRNMRGPAPRREFSDYNDYWNHRKAVGEVMRRWVVASDEIPDGSSVLDIGCGSGEFLEYLQSRHTGLVLEGTDYSSVAVESIQARGFNARLVDITSEPIGAEYDYITCFEVFEHIPEAETALRNLKDAFRNQLIISVPNVGYIGCRMRLALCGRFPITMCVYHIKEHVRHWTPRDFSEWMKLEGLTVARIEGQYGPSWLPWKKFPGLFASGLVYFIERDANSNA